MRLHRALFALTFSCAALFGQRIFTIAGIPFSHRTDIDGKPALAAPLNPVYGLLVDKPTGRLVIHDQSLVERLEPDGSLLAIAGLARQADGEIADGTSASNLRIYVLRGMAEDAAGVLYLSDSGAGRVFRVGRDGLVSTFAGGGPQPPGFMSDGGPAISAALNSPRGLVFDSRGNLVIAEVFCHCIRRVTPAGLISTIYTLPSSKEFVYFEGLAIDAQDNIFATEYSGHMVLKITQDGSATAIAGTGVAGFSGDGGPATTAQLNGPSGVTLGPNGTIYIADTVNHRIRRIDSAGNITTIAGTGKAGFSGDGGLATLARFNYPAQMLLDSGGNLLISDFLNGRIRRISQEGIVSTIAGNGAINSSPPSAPVNRGDGGPAVYATLQIVPSAVVDRQGNIYISELGGNKVRRIGLDGIVTTFAGSGLSGFSGDGGPAVQASIQYPYTVAIDSHDAIYIATADSRIRKVSPDGTITSVAGSGPGNGAIRSQGDGGPAVNATLNEPKGIAVDAQGNVYIGDTSNARLRKVDSGGVINTVAGPGIQGSDYWNAVAIDPRGNVYVAITHSQSGGTYSIVARVGSDGSLTPIAGNQKPCSFEQTEFSYDGQQATQVPLCIIVGLTIDANGVVWIPEAKYGAILKVAADGTITRVAGSVLSNNYGDGGSPLQSNLYGAGYYSPSSVAFDAAGNMIIPSGNRVREVLNVPLTVKLGPDKADWKGGLAQSQSIAVSTSVAQPLPYLVRIRTDDGGTWISSNRASGITGEPLVLSSNPAGLAPGVYRATVSVIVTVPNPVQTDMPVTLTVP